MQKEKANPFDHFDTQRLEGKGFNYRPCLDLLFSTMNVPFEERASGNSDGATNHMLDGLCTLIRHIALESEAAFNYACEGYHQFIKGNQRRYANASVVYYPLQNLQQQFYLQKEKDAGLEDLKFMLTA